MEKGLKFCLFLIVILLFIALPFASAQTYSGFNRLADNVKLFFSNGDSKVKLALEIREKEVNSALENAKSGNTEKVIENLEKAQDKLQTVQEKITLANSEEVKTNVDKVKNKIKEENLSAEFGGYILEEDKTQLTAELTLKTFEYCKTLAQESYDLMLKEVKCNPETAAPGLEKELIELKDIQIKSFVNLMLDIRSCIDDPGTCNCDEVKDVQQKAKCEKLVALALKCEYTDDEASCSELDSMKPAPGNSFARSFVPSFLINLFSKKHDMVEYNISHSDGVPEECWDKNDKPECEQYEYLKETRLDWDEYGNFIGTNRARGIAEKIPTMQESIPQCFDEKNNFLEEKCGMVTIVRNDKGLVNYIYGKGLEKVIEKFENASAQHTIDINGTEGRTIVNEMKEEINGINEEIALRTYAEGTGPGGESGVIVVGDKEGIATGSGGNNEINTEVKTGGDNEESLPEPDLNKINPELYDPDARAPGDTIDDTYDDASISEGSGNEGTNELAP